jgi:membrane dipeptidase
MNEFSVFDGHNDSILALWRDDASAEAFLDGRDDGHLDLPRANAANLAGGFFALFVPSEEQFSAAKAVNRTETPEGYEIDLPPPLSPAYAGQVTDELLSILENVAADDRIRIVRDIDDTCACIEGDELGVVVHFEGAEAIKPSLSNLEAYYERGLRSLGLAWSRPNAFAHGVSFRYPSSPDVGPGLTDRGRDLISRCNDLGIVVDCAHLTEQGFWDVHDTSTDPLVVSHTAAHEVCPSSRNLTDEQLDAVADSGGVVGLTFSKSDLNPAGGSADTVPMEVVVRHVDHLVDRMGVDHVAIGSDFDGATIPDCIGDVTGLPGVFDALEAAGYSDSDLQKISHENWLRICETTW